MLVFFFSSLLSSLVLWHSWFDGRSSWPDGLDGEAGFGVGEAGLGASPPPLLVVAMELDLDGLEELEVLEALVEQETWMVGWSGMVVFLLLLPSPSFSSSAASSSVDKEKDGLFLFLMG